VDGDVEKNQIDGDGGRRKKKCKLAEKNKERFKKKNF